MAAILIALFFYFIVNTFFIYNVLIDLDSLILLAAKWVTRSAGSLSAKIKVQMSRLNQNAKLCAKTIPTVCVQVWPVLTWGFPKIAIARDSFLFCLPLRASAWMSWRPVRSNCTKTFCTLRTYENKKCNTGHSLIHAWLHIIQKGTTSGFKTSLL